MIKNGWPVVILISLATEPRYILNFFISVEFTGPSLTFLISRYHSIAPKRATFTTTTECAKCRYLFSLSGSRVNGVLGGH